MTTTIAVVSAGLGNPSSTALLADRLSDEIGATCEHVLVTRINLRDYAHELTDHLLTGFPSQGLADAYESVKKADGLIAVTPVYSGSYGGLFKTFFDLMELGALENKPVLIAATAGTPRHSLVLDHALRPLFSYLRAITVPTGVFAATEDFASPELQARIGRAVRELSSFAEAGSAPSGEEPKRRQLEDQFANPTPFEELLANLGK